MDNRIKTLFDGLKMPREAQDLGPYLTPAVGEDPFYCLVEDDRLITSVSVETDPYWNLSVPRHLDLTHG